MALEARIAEINEECSRLIKEQVARLENKRDSLIAAARKEFENASVEKIRELIKAGDFSNEIIPEVTRHTAAMLLQHHNVERVKSSLLELYPENKKKPQKEKKPTFATIAASAADMPETSKVEVFREVKVKTAHKLPNFEPEVQPTTINAVVLENGFKVQFNNGKEYEIQGKVGFDAIAFFNKKYSLRGPKISELERALETEPNKVVRLLSNIGEKGLLYGKLTYALLCALLQYLVELVLIPPGDDAIDKSFSITVEQNHNVSITCNDDIYEVDDRYEFGNSDIKDYLEGGKKYDMDTATLSSLKAFIHRWANYCAVDYKFKSA